MRLLSRPARVARNLAARWRVTSKRAKAPPASPLISVVVPAYNEEQYIRQCLKSIATQNYRSFECIVVDDASTDGTAGIARSFASQDSRFRLVSHDVNRGLSAARNSGARVAKGALITFLDADDYLYQNALFDRVTALEGIADPRVAGSFSAIQSVAEGGEWSDSLMPYLIRRQAPVTFLTHNGECPFPVHAPAIRADVFEQFGGFDEAMRDGCEDWDLWQRILRSGFRFIPTHTVGGAYRMRQGSMRLNKAAKHSLLAADILKRAHEPVEGNTTKPYFHKPLGYYMGEVARVRRLIRGITLATISGDEAGRLRCMEGLPVRAEWPLWVVDVADEVARNLYLHAAGDQLKFSELRPQVVRISKEIIEWMELQNRGKGEEE